MKIINKILSLPQQESPPFLAKGKGSLDYAALAKLKDKNENKNIGV